MIFEIGMLRLSRRAVLTRSRLGYFLGPHLDNHVNTLDANWCSFATPRRQPALWLRMSQRGQPRRCQHSTKKREAVCHRLLQLAVDNRPRWTLAKAQSYASGARGARSRPRTRPSTMSVPSPSCLYRSQVDTDNVRGQRCCFRSLRASEVLGPGDRLHAAWEPSIDRSDGQASGRDLHHGPSISGQAWHQIGQAPPVRAQLPAPLPPPARPHPRTSSACSTSAENWKKKKRHKQ